MRFRVLIGHARSRSDRFDALVLAQFAQASASNGRPDATAAGAGGDGEAWPSVERSGWRSGQHRNP